METTLKLETIFNKTFSDDTIIIDGKEFINCTFINMLIVFVGGHFDFQNPTFENCRGTLAGDALETTRFLRFVALMNPGAPPVPPAMVQQPDSGTHH